MKERLQHFIKEDGVTVLIVLLIVIVYAYLRTPGDTFASVSDLEAQLTSGQPTIIEFYANNCSICLISKPKIDQLERDLTGQATLIRLNVKEKIALSLASQWGVVGTPTFFVLDGSGHVVYAQAGAPDVDSIKAAVTSAASVQP